MTRPPKTFAKVGKHIVREAVAKYATTEFTLDLCCGNSPLAPFFPNRVGCDITLGTGTSLLCDAHKLPFADDVFDLVVSMESFEHLHTPELAVREMHRVLRPGGRAILTVPFCYPVHEAPHDYQRYTEYGLRKLLGGHFEIEELRPLFTEEQTLAVLLQRIVFQREDSEWRRWLINAFAGWLFRQTPPPGRRFQDIGRTREGPFFTAGYIVVCRRRAHEIANASELPPGWRKFRAPRVWSNAELRRFAPLFRGSVVNISGWTDEDKEGKRYQDYFTSASEYFITNYKAELKGLRGFANEIYLDLEDDLPAELIGRFDLCFNHTTIEHIYECRKAFSNICRMSRDVVIVVVPYLQQMHGIGYGDFWRFTPQTMARMYQENGLKLRYCSANGADKASIYLFCIGYRDESWDALIPERFDLALDPARELYGPDLDNVIGARVVE